MMGSGVIEAACKTLVTQRLKQSGMRWSVSERRRSSPPAAGTRARALRHGLVIVLEPRSLPRKTRAKASR
jgi:hypothetical protein